MRSFFTQTLGKVRSMGWNYAKAWPLLFGIFLYAGSANAQLSGTYTICSSGCNYSSISAAVSALNSNGVSGPVTFNIGSGTYNETLYLSSGISGASSTNTITFKGAGRGNSVISLSNVSTPVQIYSISYVN